MNEIWYKPKTRFKGLIIFLENGNPAEDH